MYEDMTAEYLLERMLDRIDDGLDKREGSIIYDALMPFAIEMEQLYRCLDMVLDETFADTASMEYLIRRAAERGILPKTATYAHMKAAFYGAEIPVGLRYNCGLYNYTVAEKLEGELENGAYYEMICETLGSAPNYNKGFLYPVSTNDYVEGFQYAEIMDVIIPGEDDEDSEMFRLRYYDSFQSKSFGGNISDYREKLHDIAGVGGVKVYPVWNGPGTVKLIVITSLLEIPDAEFLSDLKEQIAPGMDGKGNGVAPIGHTVTIEGAKPVSITVRARFTFAEPETLETALPVMEKTIREYFLELAQTWETSNGLIVRSSQIEVRLLNIQNILNVEELTLNGTKGNLKLEDSELPELGEILHG